MLVCRLLCFRPLFSILEMVNSPLFCWCGVGVLEISAGFRDVGQAVWGISTSVTTSLHRLLVFSESTLRSWADETLH